MYQSQIHCTIGGGVSAGAARTSIVAARAALQLGLHLFIYLFEH